MMSTTACRDFIKYGISVTKDNVRFAISQIYILKSDFRLENCLAMRDDQVWGLEETEDGVFLIKLWFMYVFP